MVSDRGRDQLAEMTARQHIDYDALALEALRGVVKACLAQVSETGLLGDHHFYIAFNTQAPGVGLSKRLKEKYPDEMTIVLQHRFWDLVVEADRFEVKLTFDGIPERLVVPFKSIKVFYDPSVPYGLQFEEQEAGAGSGAAPGRPRVAASLARDADGAAGNAASPGTADAGETEGDRRRPPRRSRPDRAERQPQLVPAAPAPGAATTTESSSGQPAEPAAKPEAPKPAAPKPAAAKDAVSAGDGATTEPDAEDRGPGAKVFDLSQFRSKK
jgi:hypothetical protein